MPVDQPQDLGDIHENKPAKVGQPTTRVKKKAVTTYRRTDFPLKSNRKTIRQALAMFSKRNF